MNIRELGRRAWRKYVVDGVSASGFNQPSTADIFPFVDALYEGIQGAAAGLVRSATLGGLTAGTRVGQPGEVTAGADKGAYSWSGSAWVKVGDLIDPDSIQDSLDELNETKADQEDLDAVAAEVATKADQEDLDEVSDAVDGKLDKTMATARLLGRTSASTGEVEQLTASQAKGLLSLQNVDNTSDATKPVSAPQQLALTELDRDITEENNAGTSDDNLFEWTAEPDVGDSAANVPVVASIDRDARFRSGGGFLTFDERGIESYGSAAPDNSSVIVTSDHGDGVPRIFSRMPAINENPVLNAHALRQTRMRSRQVLDGVTTALTVNVLGDSYTHVRWHYLQTLLAALVDWLGDAGPGYVDLTGSAGTDPVPLDYPTASTAITASLTGAWAQTIFTSPTPAGGHQTASAAASVAVASSAGPVLSSAKLCYLGTGAGTARYRWNGGSWHTINLAGSGVLFADIATDLPASGVWSFDLEWVSGQIKIAGLDLRSASAGVRVNKLAKTGQTAGNIATVDRTQWIAGQAALGADLTMVMLGTNDQIAGVPPGRFAHQMGVILDRAKAAAPNGDLLVVMPPENLGTSPPEAMADLAGQMREGCRRRGITLLDLQLFFGQSPSEYGHSGRNYYDETTDAYHPTFDEGARVMADPIYRLLKYSL